MFKNFGVILQSRVGAGKPCRRHFAGIFQSAWSAWSGGESSAALRSETAGATRGFAACGKPVEFNPL